ncbi:Hypothetical protein DPCES_1533 [Desulfitobacterium hafniense]|uniref:Uncharacterized protein n=2 Tax=Bacillota TaxID=1239 RepID=A0A974GV79_SEDHY|nr:MULTISPECIES: hypothetical protein [Bacillota]NYB73088.1 hypothetical protein [Sedimentibacter hydroxybenzoicus DSM 7310]CDX01420.1 Hypothetical protein DPCES_1533 [Desulfitobacterium hafniense]
MKNNQKKNGQTLQISTEIQQSCGFADAEALSVLAAEGVCVIHKGELTALELSHVIATLSEMASDMTIHLAKACGFCDNCGDDESEHCESCGGDAVCAMLNGCKDGPSEWVANCSLCHDLLDESQIVSLPDYLLEEAGIPAGAKLEAYVDEDSGEITVVMADVQQDISDVSPGILSVLAQSGVCLAELDERIMLGEIVYGR